MENKWSPHSHFLGRLQCARRATFPSSQARIYLWLSQCRAYLLIGQHVVPPQTPCLGTLRPGWWEEQAAGCGMGRVAKLVSWPQGREDGMERVGTPDHPTLTSLSRRVSSGVHLTRRWGMDYWGAWEWKPRAVEATSLG